MRSSVTQLVDVTSRMNAFIFQLKSSRARILSPTLRSRERNITGNYRARLSSGAMLDNADTFYLVSVDKPEAGHARERERKRNVYDTRKVTDVVSVPRVNCALAERASHARGVQVHRLLQESQGRICAHFKICERVSLRRNRDTSLDRARCLFDWNTRITSMFHEQGSRAINFDDAFDAAARALFHRVGLINNRE